MAQQKRTKDEQAAQRCGMTVGQWQAARERAASDRTRGRRLAGAKAEATLASWGQVADQMPLFTDDTAQEGGH
jgi:hypothetical protein